jgi:hypothetical protein
MDFKRFEDYKEEVIQDYKKKKSEGKLPPNLDRHTPANLKRECTDVFHSRYSTTDESTFVALFGKHNSADEYYTAIKKSERDVFKPLDIFLKKDTKAGTFDRNIELLSWLIDFKPRPHRPADIFFLKNSIPILPMSLEPDTANEVLPTEISDPVSIQSCIPAEIGQEEYPVDDTKNHRSAIEDVSFGIFSIPSKFYKTIGAFLATAIILITLSIVIRPQCMYWDGKEYQSVDCDEKVEGANIVALDTARLEHMKKITNTGLITRNDIRKVYYSKVGGKIEFYTGKGENPEDNRRRLLPMTEYIFEKYVLHK